MFNRSLKEQLLKTENALKAAQEINKTLVASFSKCSTLIDVDVRDDMNKFTQFLKSKCGKSIIQKTIDAYKTSIKRDVKGK